MADRIDVELLARQNGLKEALTNLQKIRELAQGTTAAFNQNINSIRAINTALNATRREMSLFQKNLAMISKGGLDVQATNANNARIQNEIRARYRNQTAIEINEMTKAQKEVLRAGQALENQRKKVGQAGMYSKPESISNAIKTQKDNVSLSYLTQDNAIIKREQKLLEQLKSRQQEILMVEKQRTKENQRIVSLQEQTLSMQNKAVNSEYLKAQRDLRVASITDDAGASLFKIQGTLMINYMLMNQLFNLFQFGTQFVLELDKAFYDLQAITTSTDTAMKGLKQSIIDVAQETKFSATEVAQAATTLGQAGFSATQIQDSIKSVAVLATATGTDLATSVDVASTVVSVFNLRAEDMAHVANVLTGSINETKLTMDKLALGMQYAGNIAAEAGLSFDETTAILGAMANAGIRSGSTLGTGLRQVLIELMTPSEKFVGALQSVGLSIEDIDVKSKGFVGVMETLRDAGFNAAKGFEAFEVRSAAAFAAIQSNPDILNNLRQSFLYTNAAIQANETQMKSLANAAEQLSGALGAFIYNAAGPTVVALRETAQMFTWFLDIVNKGAPVIAVFGTALSGLAITVVVSHLAKLTAAFMGVTVAAKAGAGAATLFNLAIGGVAIPMRLVFLATTALIGGIALLNGGFSKMKATIEDNKATLEQQQADHAKTVESVTALDESIQRLTNRYAALRDEPAEVFTEMVGLTTQFGDMGLVIENQTTPKIEELIEALRRLRKELVETEAAQIGATMADRATLFRNMAKQAYGDVKPSFVNQGGLIKKINPDSLSGAQRLYQQFARTDLADPSTDLASLRAQVEIEKSKISKELRDLSKRINEGDKAGGPTAVKALRAESELLKSNLAKLNDFGAQITKGLGDMADAVSAAYSNSDVTQNLQDEILKQRIEYDLKYEELQNAKSPEERTKLLQELRKMREDMLNALKKSVDNGWQQLVKDIEGDLSRPLTDNERAGLEARNQTSINAVNTDLKDKEVKSVEITLTKIEANIASAQTGLEKVQQAYQHVADRINSKIAAFDAIISETEDIERGGLRGKYGDAELEMMRDRQKELQAQAIKAQIDSLPAVIAAQGNLIGAQSYKVANLRTKESATEPGTIIARVNAEKELNAAIQEQTTMQIELNDLVNQYNAMMGIQIEQNISLSDQVRYVISNYMEMSAIQSSWSYDLKATMFSFFDDTKGAFKTLVTDWVTGTETIGDATRKMLRSILESALDKTTTKLGDGLMGAIGGGLSSLFGGSLSSGSMDLASKGSLFSFNGGGIVKANNGAYIGRDNQTVIAQAGEGIVNRAAMSVIGRDNFNNLNAMGNRAISETSLGPAPVAPVGEPTILNVYVVSQDEKPQMSKNDVIVAVAENLTTGGITKKLVKQIVVGSM